MFAYTIGSDNINYTGTYNIRTDVSQVNPLTKYFRDQYLVEATGDLKIAEKGSNISFSLNNIKMSLFGTTASGVLTRYSYFNPNSIAQMELRVYDKQGNSHLVEKITSGFNVKTDGLLTTIGADFENVPCDVYGVNIVLIYYGASGFDNNDGDSSLTYQHWDISQITKGYGFDNSKLVINVDNNVSGLLSSIIGFIQSILQGVQNIFTKITDFMTSVGNWFNDLFSKLGNWFTNLIGSISSFMTSVGNWFSDLFDYIIDLPGIMWNWIENGLKSLFVPDSAYIEEYKEKWDTVLSERFGAVYQVFDLLVTYFENFNVARLQTSITIPSTTIDLPDGAAFTFGGYEVQIVPQGFEFLATVCRTIVDIVCTLLFINTMKRKFDFVLEG